VRRRIWSENLKQKTPFGRPRYSWEDNIRSWGNRVESYGLDASGSG
jgi:hypothetical protein